MSRDFAAVLATPCWLCVNMGLFHAAHAISVWSHECSHALVGRVLGLHVFSIVMGSGTKVVEFHVGRTRVRFNAIPFHGRRRA
jgi:membrane-associated protease RseP (regulator of RpoE activity)